MMIIIIGIIYFYPGWGIKVKKREKGVFPLSLFDRLFTALSSFSLSFFPFFSKKSAINVCTVQLGRYSFFGYRR